MSYYNRKKVLEIIKNYKVSIEAIQENKSNGISSAGVAKGGIDSIMPKARGIKSDPTAEQGIRLANKADYFAKLKTDIKYLQDRIDRVPKRLRETLDLRLSGCSVKDIYYHTNKSQSRIYRELNEIADSIIGI